MTAAVMAQADPSFLVSFQRLFRHSLQARQRQFEEDEFEDDNEISKQQELALFQDLRTLGWIRKRGNAATVIGESFT